MLGDCAGHSEPPEKQVAIIAQKVVDAKQSEEQRGRFITAPDTRAFTLWTTLSDHLASLFRRRFWGGGSTGSAVTLLILMRARKSSISRPMRSEVSALISSEMGSRER